MSPGGGSLLDADAPSLFNSSSGSGHCEEDVPQQNDCNQEEVVDEQQLLNQERNFIVVHVGADCSQIKEEQEDICVSQEGEQFGLKQETQTFDEDAPQLHDCKAEEVLTVQQLCNQERNSSVDQEEQDGAQVKKEEEELCSSQEEEDFGLKQETHTFMVTPTDEDNDKNETEPNSEQLLSYNSPDMRIHPVVLISIELSRPGHAKDHIKVELPAVQLGAQQ
ncbi:uncharacterized protein KZ484_017835 [Pholidichthys leucotaenia]